MVGEERVDSTQREEREIINEFKQSNAFFRRINKYGWGVKEREGWEDNDDEGKKIGNKELMTDHNMSNFKIKPGFWSKEEEDEEEGGGETVEEKNRDRKSPKETIKEETKGTKILINRFVCNL
jgi:hypothetical protein